MYSKGLVIACHLAGRRYHLVEVRHPDDLPGVARYFNVLPAEAEGSAELCNKRPRFPCSGL